MHACMICTNVKSFWVILLQPYTFQLHQCNYHLRNAEEFLASFIQSIFSEELYIIMQPRNFSRGRCIRSKKHQTSLQLGHLIGNGSLVASFPGLPRLQLLIACSIFTFKLFCKQSKAGAGKGLGTRLVFGVISGNLHVYAPCKLYFSI